MGGGAGRREPCQRARAGAYDSQRGPPLQLWHTHVPHELKAAEIDKADWKSYLVPNNRCSTMCARRSRRSSIRKSSVSSNRYFDGSPIYPGKFQHDWNRSYIMEPDGSSDRARSCFSMA